MTIKLLKEKSKRNLKGNKFQAALGTLIYLLITIAIGSMSVLSAAIDKHYISFLIFCISILVFAYIQPGYRSMFLNTSRNSKININDMFNKGFLYKKSLLIQIIIAIIESCLYISILLLTIYLYTKTLPNSFLYLSDRIMVVGNTSLSEILNVIPYVAGPLTLITIILLLTYSMPYNFLLDNPSFDSIKCFRASRKMMKHNKFKLLRLYLSFILWFILGSLTLGLAYLWIIPYINVTVANFYDVLKGTYVDQNSKVINNNFNNIMFNDTAAKAPRENTEVLDGYNKSLQIQKETQSNVQVEEFDIQDIK